MRRPLLKGFCGLLAVTAGIGLYLGGLQLTGNFHPVVEGALYRSAQPDPAALERYVRDYGIRTVVNLRGGNPDAGWYRAERAASQHLGLTHIDFPMSAKRELTQEQAAQLVALLSKAERPILIHCQAGADRSGLAAALYVAAVAGGGEEAAERQISLRYGHISLPIAKTFAMDRSFEALEPWLGYPDS
ncbi:dual specificity protein phosphatase family protein [Niveispirillum sp. KHB5.9]|uniref:dual specificity protein phosphatase family protein n=1 Tax=Niveispirillum sp. KHB5.9 TaxID=3400269 RepID=UPI003A8BA139